MRRRWQDGATLLLGLWAIASPWVFAGDMHLKAFGAAESVTQNFWTVGVLVAAMASAAMNTSSVLVEAGSGLAGAWLIVSPWALSYTESAPLVWDAVLTGVGISLLAMLALVRACRDIDVMHIADH